uniref:Si:dkey-172h23.2 n=1 Tax=Dicentrarchus labrax TaxID=13489 RepID=A0A8C4HRR2_DICLA
MKLNPQQAPLYGRCVITVQLADEELAGEEGVDYFLLFAGSTQRHLTSTLRSNHDTLQAVCPAHDCCEVVLVTLCSPCLGRVAPLAEHRFNFVQDLAFDMAQFLVSTAGRADGLDGALLLDECQIPLQECERLDESLALALHHLTLPPGWSLLGRKLTNNTDPNPQETLLHFSARRGLFRVTHFLLQQSGAREALRLANRQGHTPSTIAALRGHERDLPNPSLMDYGDVIEEPESAVPRPSIEGLHEGEPPPDINSLEQNQETAGRDYATEQRGLAPETGCHSGNCTGTTSGKELDREDVAQPSGYSIESTTLPSSDEPDDIADCQTTGNSMEDIQTDPSLEPSPEMVPRSSNRQADLDLGITHGLSSDDDGSFQSVGSSTTEIFHPTQDNTCMVNPDLLQTKIAELSSTGLKMEGLNDSKPGENNEPDTGSELTVTDCCQTGTEPESQLSPSLQTMEALNIEGTGEEIAPELSNENLSLGPALLQSGDSLMVKVDESKPGEADDSELNAGIEYLASEVTSRVVFKPSPSVAEESDVINPLEGDHHKETSEKSAVNLAEKSGDVQLVPHQPKLDISERTADQTWSPEEGIQTGDTITAGLDSGGGEGGGGGAGEAEEEAKDRVTEVLRRSCLLRNSIRSLSPLRRHSWGPGKNNGGDAEMNQRREKKEKEKEGKEKDKKAINGHLFTTISSGQATQCSQCNKAFNSKDAYHCTRKYLCSFLFLFFSFLKGKVIIVHKLNTNELLMTNTHEIQILSASCVVGEGTEMMDGQLMGEFEAEAKELEADSWSLGVEQQYLQQLDKELVKRQDVIYELMQTEIHHIRTLRIMSEVYSKGLQKEVQLEQQTVEKLFPALDELLELHTQHLLRLLERKREGQFEWGSSEGGFIINRIGDILVSQFSGSNGESMKRVYGKFCSRHNEAVNFYKDLLTKDKRFKAFIKKKMSSSIVRRLGIPECILLVTQRITKYPVLIQRMLQHTKESEEEYDDLTDSVRLVKEVIAAVDSKVNEHEKRRRLKEFHGRMDSKSIMMMKSGQIFAREDLLRRRLIHDGVLQLKNSQGRLKDVHALLLSDVFVFLQEKDQKYVFAMLDQRSTVISLQKLIVREVANEERGLFLITAGIEKPEMMEVLAGTKDERNTWMQLIQEAMQSMEKDEDEGIPSETEDDKRQLETKAKEMRDLLKQKDTEIMSLLEEKVRLFRGMWEGLNAGEEACRQAEPFFRSACSLEPPRGASVMKDALQEVETLQALVNGSLGGAMASVQEGGGAGPVCLPRRAETFGGFDSHQMHSSKSGDRDESEDTAGDLRRTDSYAPTDSDLICLSFGSGCVQAVVVQQDSFIEDQRQALSERSSSCTSLSRPTSRPSSLIEQEKQRSLEKQRQELASLQRQQAAHAEEKRRREKEWDLREHHLTEREGLVHIQEEEVLKQHKELEEQKRELQSKKEEYQKDLERLRDAQRKLERDREAVQRQLDKMQEVRMLHMFLTSLLYLQRTPSTTSDEFQFPGSSQSLELDPLELSSSSSSSLSRLQPQRSKPKGKGLNPFTSSSTNLKGSDANNQLSKSLLQLAKNKSKEGKEKKKKKGKGGNAQTAGREW